VINLNANIYQIRISLVGLAPPIWRSIQIPADYSFWDLHIAIQDAMGWSDNHLHEFRFYSPIKKKMERIGPAGVEQPEGVLVEWEEPLDEYMFIRNPSGIYRYDFGDSWTHAVQFEAELPAVPSQDYPLCLAGERKCPPEDCGGIEGYKDLLEIISDDEHPKYDSTVEWLGGSFDPEEFDPAEVQFRDPKKRWDELYSELDS